MTAEIASVIIIVVACATIIYFVRQSIKTFDDENDEKYYKYRFTFLVEYSSEFGVVECHSIHITTIARRYDKALEKTLSTLLFRIGQEITNTKYSLKDGYLIDVDYEIVK